MARATNHGLGLACFALVVAMAGATQFKVGGDNGWSVPAANAEPYNTWAERTRFQIGDSLAFVYPKDKDSVLLVEPADYNACNTSAYVRKFDDGNTVFTFDRSGAFFFISGVEANCRGNEKLIVIVLASRNGTGGAPSPSSSSPPPSSPLAPPPASSTPPQLSLPVHFKPAAGDVPLTSLAAAPTAPTSAPTTPSTPPPASSPPAPSSTPSAPAGSPPAPPSANAPSAQGTNSTGTSPPPAGSSDRNGAALTVAAGLVSSAGSCIIGYAMLAL